MAPRFSSKVAARIFPSLTGWRSAAFVIGASVFWWPAATLQGRRNGSGGGVRLEPNVFGQEVGVLAQPVARPVDLDDDGVVKQSVEQGRRDNGIPDQRMMPPLLMVWSLKCALFLAAMGCLARCCPSWA